MHFSGKPDFRVSRRAQFSGNPDFEVPRRMCICGTPDPGPIHLVSKAPPLRNVNVFRPDADPRRQRVIKRIGPGVRTPFARHHPFLVKYAAGGAENLILPGMLWPQIAVRYGNLEALDAHVAKVLDALQDVRFDGLARESRWELLGMT